MSRRNKLLALFLCAVLLFGGGFRPTALYATVVEEDTALDTSTGFDPAVDEPGGATGNAQIDQQISALQSEINSTQSKLEDVKAEQKKIEQEIANVQGEKQNAEATKQKLGAQVTLKQEQIASLQYGIVLLEKQIELLEKSIELKQYNIELKQADIDEKYEQFKMRITAQYMQNDGTTLGLLMGADSFSDFLSSTEYMSSIAKYDQDLMAVLTEERKALEEEMGRLEEEMDQIEEKKGVIAGEKAQEEIAQQQLATEYNKAELEIHSLSQMEVEFNKDLKANIEKQKQMRDAMDALFQQIKFLDNPYVGGSMAYPLPGFYTVSSNYGSRFGGSDFHTGIDLTGSGCNGASIVAANDGTVTKVNLSHSPGQGYGMYLIIDHGVENGKNISTLYAHCSGILVSEGQEVKKSQPIALVGSTGWSTGPHLHFEVRIGTGHVSPGPYIGM